MASCKENFAAIGKMENKKEIQESKEKIKCEKCGYIWKPRKIGKPVACPACKSYRWEVKNG